MGQTALRSTLREQLTDCDGEAGETDSSLDFARDCEYIDAATRDILSKKCEEIGKMLGGMMKKAPSFAPAADL